MVGYTELWHGLWSATYKAQWDEGNDNVSLVVNEGRMKEKCQGMCSTIGGFSIDAVTLQCSMCELCLPQ